ncbi:MAG: glycine--tRNA ligase subunit beta [Firmicutes bacterium]|nr:glycine--tRNA ligase subunit beta [Bacillota bacterium]
MAKDLLLEIGTEEIPARFIPNSLLQLEDKAQKMLKEAGLGFSGIRVTGTPRRLALHVFNLAARAIDREKEVKGPPKKIAFDAAGNPSKAALGFARSQGIPLSETMIKEIKGGEYLFALLREEGRPTVEILPQLLVDIIQGLTFPTTMRWGDKEQRFIRPIHWLLALWGEEIIPFSVAGVESGRETYGHRFLSHGPIDIMEPDDYYDRLREHYVVVDPQEREELIREQSEELARAKGGKVLWDKGLLEEVVNLVEYPTGLLGSFADAYLELPAEVVITPMKEHQRYFPVVDLTGELLPLFITIRNGTSDNIHIVREGNEKVLRARLEDAKFFYEEDQKIPLQDRVKKLKDVAFLEGLGSIFDKVERVRDLAHFIVEELGLDEPVFSLVDRTATLAKADLTTNMVNEFSELQGVMGREYALLNGENPVVAQGIYEHYLPRFAGDELPQTMAGTVVSMADKLDSICGCFGIGIVPTGSADPYALRRQAYGVVNILLGSDLNIRLSALIEYGLGIYQEQNLLQRDMEGMTRQILDFFAARIRHACRDRGAAYDSIDAVLSADYDQVAKVRDRLEAVEEMRRQPEFASILAMYNRVHNLACKAAAEETFSPELLRESAEKILYQQYQRVLPRVKEALRQWDYKLVLVELLVLHEGIDGFFDQVLVMVEEEELKNNRLALLRKLEELFLTVADFSKIVAV